MTPHRHAAILALSLAALAHAQQPFDFSAVQLPDRARLDHGDRVSLRLSDAIAAVLAGSKEIAAARVDLRRADLKLQRASAAYDSRVFLNAFTERRTSPVSSILGGASNGKLTESDTEVAPRYEGRLPTGGLYQIGVSANRQTSDNFYVPLNAQFPTRLNLTFTQPLLRGLRTDDTRRTIEVARRNQSLSSDDFQQRVIDVVVRAEGEYWDLVAGYASLQIQSDALALAKQLQEANQRQVDVQQRAPIDIVEARKQAQVVELNYDDAVQSVARAENALKALMADGLASPVWSQLLVPTTTGRDESERLARLTRPIADLIRAALENRKELAQNDAERQINEIDARYYRDRLRPQVDVEASYAAAGLSGGLATRPANPLLNADLNNRVNQLSTLAGLPALASTGSFGVPDMFIGSVGQSGVNLLAQRFPTVRAGVRIELPLHNRAAEADVALAAADAQRIRFRREELQLKIAREVRDAVQSLLAAQDRMTRRAAARATAAELFESEKRKFQEGVSTVFLVLDRQNALIDARLQEAQSRTDLYRRVADAERALGLTLESHSVSIQNVQKP
jgi:outer membrane protein